MNKTSIGIIGCGNISTTYLDLAPLFPGIEIRAIADINPEVSASRAAQYGTQSLPVEQLLTSDDIDIVVNLTIPDAHFDVSKSILEAGKHVYSEKPFVLSLQDGQSLAQIADAGGLRIGSAPDTFLGGVHQLARKQIDDGLIGDVVAGTCHVMSHGMEHWHPNPDFFFLPGAGPVLDLGPYYIANLIQLIGPVERVTALATSATPTRRISNGPRDGEDIPVETPTNVHALLAFQSGATITLSASWDVWAHGHNEMELYGLDGSLILPDPNFFGGYLEHAGHDGHFVPLPGWDHPFGVANQDHGGTMQANYRTAGLAEMADALTRNRPHRCSFELALHTVEVMTAILQSGEERSWIDLSTTCTRPDFLSPDDARNLMTT